MLLAPVSGSTVWSGGWERADCASAISDELESATMTAAGGMTTCGVGPCADMLASHTADIDVDKEMIAAFGEFDAARTCRLDVATFRQILTGSGSPKDNTEEVLTFGV